MVCVCMTVSVCTCVCRLAYLFAVPPALPLSSLSFQAGSLPAPGAHVFSARLGASQPQPPSHLYTHALKLGYREAWGNQLVR